jgi:hypothetical protein
MTEVLQCYVEVWSDCDSTRVVAFGIYSAHEESFSVPHRHDRAS